MASVLLGLCSLLGNASQKSTRYCFPVGNQAPIGDIFLGELNEKALNNDASQVHGTTESLPLKGAIGKEVVCNICNSVHIISDRCLTLIQQPEDAICYCLELPNCSEDRTSLY